MLIDYGYSTTKDPEFLFEKRFDALAISPDKKGNNLNGTCQLGQVCAAVLSSVFANVPSCCLLYIILSPYSPAYNARLRTRTAKWYAFASGVHL